MIRCTPSLISLPLPVAREIAVAATRALLDELETWPKPGLVSHIDSGSHTDMNAVIFRASAEALQPFFGAIASAAAEGADMDELRQIGLAAERAMMVATGGVNTHRGAIFGLGLVCAAAGAVWAESVSQHNQGVIAAPLLGSTVSRRWGASIAKTVLPTRSNGSDVSRRFGAGGARAEAASGFARVYEVGLPALRLGRRLAMGNAEAARVQAFFALVASLEDTNLLHRGGSDGLQFARTAAAEFLADGGVGKSAWLRRAALVHQSFIDRNLSPGGSGDLLSITVFLDGLGG